MNVAPKNHSSSGVDVFAGRGLGVTTTEHSKLTVCPTVTASGAEMETGPMFTAWIKIIIHIVTNRLFDSLTDVNIDNVPQ